MDELETVSEVDSFADVFFHGVFSTPASFTGVNESVDWEKKKYSLDNERVVERIFSIEDFSGVVCLSSIESVRSELSFYPLSRFLLFGEYSVNESDVIAFSHVQDLIRVYACVVQLKRYEKEVSHRVVSDVDEELIDRVNRKMNKRQNMLNKLSYDKVECGVEIDANDIVEIIRFN